MIEQLDPHERPREAPLRSGEDIFRDLANNIPQLAWIADERGSRVWYNARWYEYTGTTFEEVQGWGWHRVHHPDHVDRAVENMRRAVATGERWEDTFPLRSRTGEYRWFLSNAIPVRNEQGKIVRWFGTNTDVTTIRQAQDTLRSSEQRYREIGEALDLEREKLQAIIRALPVGVGIMAPDGTALSMNEAALRLHGFSTEQEMLSALADYLQRFALLRLDGSPLPVDDWPAAKALRGEAVTDYPVRLRNLASGVERVVSYSAVPVRNSAGEPVLFLYVMDDITERRQAEAALRAAHDTFRHLVENSPFGVYAVDADFRLVQVSAGAQKVFENVRPLLGRDFAEVLRVVWPEPFASEATGRFRHTLETGVPYRSPSTVERRQDIGEVESYDWKVERVMLPDGRFGVVCHFYDLSERQRYEAALHGKTQQIESLLTNAPLGVAFFDRQHRYVQVNEDLAQINGIAAADHIGRTLQDVLPVTGPQIAPLLDRIFETGEAVRNLELTGETPREPGVQRHWLTGMYPVRDEQGKVILVGTWVAEITDQKRAEQALREADRRKSEFLAVLSHELRNPLAPIRTAIYLLEHAAAGTEQASRAKQVIRRQTDHLTRLVDDLLDITRISRGKIDLKIERLDLRDVVRKTTDDLRSNFEQSGIELRVGHAAGPVWVDADRTRISQVLGNLLHNSLKFTPADGIVTVRVATGDGAAELRVRDSGVGMEPDQIDGMFEPFAQGENSLARTKGGLGLGLSLVRGLTHLHGGSVLARSEGPGRGAEFVVRLPLSSSKITAPQSDTTAVSGSGRMVVVVEDNVDAGHMLAEMLALHGHRVRVARDGRSGIALAREIRPDVVVCDIGLPDMDGYEVARALRGDAAVKSARLVALSGYAQSEDRQRSREAGFDAHIAKPPDPDELMNALADGVFGSLTP